MSAEIVDDSFERSSVQDNFVRLIIPTDMPHLPQVDSVWVRKRWERVVEGMPHIQTLSHDAIERTIRGWSSESRNEIREYLVAGGKGLKEDTLLEIDISYKRALLDEVAEQRKGYAEEPGYTEEASIVNDDQPWGTRAACRDTDPALFFPEDEPKDWRRLAIQSVAQKVCGTCVVRPECFVASLDQDERFGTWAGVPGEVREPLLRKLKKVEKTVQTKA